MLTNWRKNMTNVKKKIIIDDIDKKILDELQQNEEFLLENWPKG